MRTSEPKLLNFSIFPLTERFRRGVTTPTLIKHQS